MLLCMYILSWIENEYSADLDSEIPPAPNYNLVVLDVHAGFLEQKHDPGAASAVSAGHRQSKFAVPAKVGLIPVAVDVHQVRRLLCMILYIMMIVTYNIIMSYRMTMLCGYTRLLGCFLPPPLDHQPQWTPACSNGKRFANSP